MPNERRRPWFDFTQKPFANGSRNAGGNSVRFESPQVLDLLASSPWLDFGKRPANRGSMPNLGMGPGSTGSPGAIFGEFEKWPLA
jgi:hypothetical protein